VRRNRVDELESNRSPRFSERENPYTRTRSGGTRRRPEIGLQHRLRTVSEATMIMLCRVARPRHTGARSAPPSCSNHGDERPPLHPPALRRGRRSRARRCLAHSAGLPHLDFPRSGPGSSGAPHMTMPSAAANGPPWERSGCRDARFTRPMAKLGCARRRSSSRPDSVRGHVPRNGLSGGSPCAPASAGLRADLPLVDSHRVSAESRFRCPVTLAKATEELPP